MKQLRSPAGPMRVIREGRGPIAAPGVGVAEVVGVKALPRGSIARRCGEREPVGEVVPRTARPRERALINRSAVIVRPRQPFLDGVRAADDEDAPLSVEAAGRRPLPRGHRNRYAVP